MAVLGLCCCAGCSLVVSGARSPVVGRGACSPIVETEDRSPVVGRGACSPVWGAGFSVPGPLVGDRLSAGASRGPSSPEHRSSSCGARASVAPGCVESSRIKGQTRVSRGGR